MGSSQYNIVYKNKICIQVCGGKMENEKKKDPRKFVFGNERFGGSYTPGEFEFNFPEDMSREEFERMFTRASSSRASRLTMTGILPTSSGIRPYFTISWEVAFS